MAKPAHQKAAAFFAMAKPAHQKAAAFFATVRVREY
jgi:hypothetical protein